MIVKSLNLDPKLSSGLNVVFDLVQFEIKTKPNIVTIFASRGQVDPEDTNPRNYPLRLNLRKESFVEEDLHAHGFIHGGQKMLESVARKLCQAIREQLAHEEINMSRILQLAALRAIKEQEIADINRELNQLLKSEMNRITY